MAPMVIGASPVRPRLYAISREHFIVILTNSGENETIMLK